MTTAISGVLEPFQLLLISKFRALCSRGYGCQGAALRTLMGMSCISSEKEVPKHTDFRKRENMNKK